MERPKILWGMPLDIVDARTHPNFEQGVLVYIPEWVVRAYRLRSKINGSPYFHNLNSRIMLKISDEGMCLKDSRKKYKTTERSRYFRENWSKKLLAEERKERENKKQ